MKKNKYLISADIEGISGVTDKSFADLDGKHYELAKRYMLHDVNAVITGILEADANAWILVRDAHGAATNLDLERLHPEAQLLQGWGNLPSMVYPVDETYQGVFLVGYHGGGQNMQAVLAHTYSSVIHEVKINDLIINETGIAALYASHYKVPVAFISGDDLAVKEAKEQLADIDLASVIVKESLARDCTLALPLTRTRDLLVSGAEAATVNLLNKRVKVWQPELPIKTEIKLCHAGYKISLFAKLAGILGFDQSYVFDHDNLIIRYSATSALEMLQRFNLIIELVHGIKAFA